MITKSKDSSIKFFATFLGFTGPENIEAFFNKKYQTWIYRNSDTKDKAGEDSPDSIFILKRDQDGNITNATYSGTTKDGIPLTEKDFIQYELALLDQIEVSGLDKRKRLAFYSDFLKDKLKQIDNPTPEHPEPAKEAKKERAWLEVGVLFATGEMDALLRDHNGNATAVARHLGNESRYRPYISESHGNSTDRDKNIFSRPDKIQSIKDYCAKNGIPIIDERFLTT